MNSTNDIVYINQLKNRITRLSGKDIVFVGQNIEQSSSQVETKYYFGLHLLLVVLCISVLIVIYVLYTHFSKKKTHAKKKTESRNKRRLYWLLFIGVTGFSSFVMLFLYILNSEYVSIIFDSIRIFIGNMLI